MTYIPTGVEQPWQYPRRAIVGQHRTTARTADETEQSPLGLELECGHVALRPSNPRTRDAKYCHCVQCPPEKRDAEEEDALTRDGILSGGLPFVKLIAPEVGGPTSWGYQLCHWRDLDRVVYRRSGFPTRAEAEASAELNRPNFRDPSVKRKPTSTQSEEVMPVG